MASLTLDKVRKTFGTVEVLKEINLAIEDGEFLVLVGPSGCGKSTLLNLIAGLETSSDGEIRIGDRVINNVHPKDRNIAMVFQSYALYPNMTVRKNITFGLEIRGVASSERDKAVDDVARLLQIENLLDRKPSQLSGGQRQRVAMGRALVRNPDIFLFDEPLSNLDAKLRVDMRLEIKNLQKRLGTTSVYVTHDQVEAMTLADRLIVMNGGVAEQVGTPIELYEKPATRFVAGFIGSPSMNFIDGTVSDDRSHVMLNDGTRLDLDHDVAANRPVVVGIRPEHLSLNTPSNSKITARVRIIEALGAETLVYLNFGDKNEAITIRMQGTHQFETGSELVLYSNPQQIHLFDRESGHRI